MIQLASTAPTYSAVRSRVMAAHAAPPPGAAYRMPCSACELAIATSAADANVSAPSTRLLNVKTPLRCRQFVFRRGSRAHRPLRLTKDGRRDGIGDDLRAGRREMEAVV